MESYSICPLVSGLVHLADSFKDSPMLLHVPEFHSFFRPNNTPLYKPTALCLFFHLLMNMWAVSLFGY